MDLPALPPGFKLDTAEPAPTTAELPPIPAGFKLDSGDSATAPSQPPAALRPIANIPKDIGQDFAAGSANVKQGEADLMNQQADLGGRVMGGIRTALGGAQQAVSPVTGAGRALVSDPIRDTKLPGSQTAANIADAGIGMVGPGAEASLVRGAARAAPRVAEGVASKAASIVPKAVERNPLANSDAMKALAAKQYAAADAAGATFKPKFSNSFLEHAQSVLPQEELGKAVTGENNVTKLVGRLEAIKDQPMTFKAAQEIDEHLSDMIDKEYANGRLSKEGKQIQDLQSEFRRRMDSATQGDIQSGKNGAAALKQGRQIWSQAAKIRDIERIDERAKLAENPTATFRSGLRTMLSNPARMRAYTTAEQEALRAAAKSGKADVVLKLLSSRLAPYAAGGIGAGLGHLPGFVAGEGIGLGAQALAKRSLANSQQNTANRLFNIMGTLPGAEPIQ